MSSEVPEHDAAALGHELALARAEIARLLACLDQRDKDVEATTRELQVALDRQTAVAAAMSLISQSVTDLPHVLGTLVRSAGALCRADCGVLWLCDEAGRNLYAGSHFGYGADFQATLEAARIQPDPHSTYAAGRTAVSGEIIITDDVTVDPRFNANAHHATGGCRSILSMPLRRDGALLGVFGLDANACAAFGAREVELVKTFADQAVIAMHNARLFRDLDQRTRELARSLEDLHKAQDRLVQTEKLASLGQLTAGIAHEIKNPLNFVNNFSALSVDLVDDLLHVLGRCAIEGDAKADIDEIAGLLKANLEKITGHGRRADSIVRNMLLHSRGGSGERRQADVNALVEESLNLAFHGARSQMPDFDVVLERSYDPHAGMAEIFPQDITRVLLNLIGNGFHALRHRGQDREQGYEPRLTVSTQGWPDRVVVHVRDNGTGIPDGVRQKMFEPFYTTKPAGEGTGLGLSLSHDIVVKQHMGQIDVETRVGEFTHFTITLPRGSAAGVSGSQA